MRRVDKELRRAKRAVKQLEECICTPLCKEEKIIPESGNGCRVKLSCEYYDYHFAHNYDKILAIKEQKSYLESKRDMLSLYS